ncbi:hypothetical protein [Phytobacter diazotrophicus]|uniref:hypothetical protein n=1 Tax=Phytobacter diazotrophicus TaxID=395631 RepID=UPI0029364AE8|nr:hypothetical protein [Phytobacter diazotrophicus]MDV2875660.1 hypothetical protein [Phytobacter diazotrophicus]
MADKTTTTTTQESPVVEEGNAQAQIVKFCPICGSQMYQGMRYGLLCWICPDPDCDFIIPI